MIDNLERILLLPNNIAKPNLYIVQDIINKCMEIKYALKYQYLVGTTIHNDLKINIFNLSKLCENEAATLNETSYDGTLNGMLNIFSNILFVTAKRLIQLIKHIETISCYQVSNELKNNDCIGISAVIKILDITNDLIIEHGKQIKNDTISKYEHMKSKINMLDEIDGAISKEHITHVLEMFINKLKDSEIKTVIYTNPTLHNINIINSDCFNNMYIDIENTTNIIHNILLSQTRIKITNLQLMSKTKNEQKLRQVMSKYNSIKYVFNYILNGMQLNEAFLEVRQIIDNEIIGISQIIRDKSIKKIKRLK